MKYKITTSIFFLLFSALFMSSVYSQEAILPSGGDYVNSGGSISFSIGQILTTTTEGSNGSAAQGVQLAYEFYLTQSCLGDADRNGIVNIIDLVVISGNFGCSAGCELGDSNFDGFVNILDLVSTSSNFGIICP